MKFVGYWFGFIFYERFFFKRIRWRKIEEDVLFFFDFCKCEFSYKYLYVYVYMLYSINMYIFISFKKGVNK